MIIESTFELFFESISFSKVWKTNASENNITVKDFSVCAGELILVEGPNGSGKTTFVSSIAGETGLTDGEIIWHSATKDDVILMHQNYEELVLPWLTCKSNILIGDNKLKEEDYLEVVPRILRSRLRRHAYTLSGGEKQAMILSQTLLASHKVKIFDEPFSNLDVKTANFFCRAIIRNLISQTSCAIVVCHNPPEVLLNFSSLKRIKIVRNA